LKRQASGTPRLNMEYVHSTYHVRVYANNL
jgi:hypothetical protein